MFAQLGPDLDSSIVDEDFQRPLPKKVAEKPKIEIEIHPGINTACEPALWMLKHADVAFTTLQASTHSKKLFPGVIINRQRHTNPNLALRNLGNQLGYYQQKED